MKVRIVSQNPVYGFKGKLFAKADGQGNAIDHEVDDELGNELLAIEGTPFRRVDDEGEAVANDEDLHVNDEVEADIAARTVNVDNSNVATGRTAKQDEVVAKKTVKIETKKPKKAGAGDISLTDLQNDGGTADDTADAVEV